ncbi:hypothetical protein B5K03_29500 [Rhizobium phaseoli]|nr:hypothetical protein B5K03_29500 [Rhizobium phaseoli]
MRPRPIATLCSSACASFTQAPQHRIRDCCNGLGEVDTGAIFLWDTPMFHVIAIVTQIWPPLGRVMAQCHEVVTRAPPPR